MNLTKAIFESFKYFAIVFAAGFLLGVLRVFYLVPYLGEVKAELLELPWMLLVTFFVARALFPAFGNRKFSNPQRLSIGALALAYLLAAEFLVVLLIRQQGIAEYLTSRDPFALSAYLIALVLFALMPLLINWRNNSLNQNRSETKRIAEHHQDIKIY